MTTTTPIAPPAADPNDPSALAWLKRVPLLTGVLAALAGFLTVHGANLSNQAIYQSNQGVLHQARASDVISFHCVADARVALLSKKRRIAYDR